MAKKELNLVLVTTEIVPFSKVGGLADVMGALPDELEKLGVSASIFTPLYSSIDRSRFGVKPVGGLKALEVRLAASVEKFRLYTCLKPGTRVSVRSSCSASRPSTSGPRCAVSARPWLKISCSSASRKNTAQ